ncbi:MAG TPA: radical SAM protein [Candidatus Nanoarchaeia archaeon]|nr:radical SAM protein [Candidatus Nanoarchaeia archaeon]
MQGYIAEVTDLNKTLFNKEKVLTVLFSGCNFRCPWCFVPELLEFKEQKDVQGIKNDIRRLCPGKKSIIFSGGEPLLQKLTLRDLCIFSKSIGLKTGIETNGSRPDVLGSLLKEDLLDFIALDLKTQFDEEQFERATQAQTFFISGYQIMNDIRKSLRILKDYEDTIDIEIRTVIIPGILFRKEDLMAIAAELRHLRCTWRIQPFIPGKCVAKQIEQIEAPSDRFLETLADACQSKYPQLRIEIGNQNEETPEAVLY